MTVQRLTISKVAAFSFVGALVIIVSLWSIPLATARSCAPGFDSCEEKTVRVRSYGFPLTMRRVYETGSLERRSEAFLSGFLANLILFFAPPFILGLMHIPEVTQPRRRRRPLFPTYRAERSQRII
jgi:hypothetical protein